MISKGKRTLGLMSMVGLLVMSSSVVASAAELKGTVITQYGRVYQSADEAGTLVDTFPIGTDVFIRESIDQWYRVYDYEAEIEGWMPQSTVSVEQESQMSKGRVTASILNVRSQPTTESDIVKKLPVGTLVTIVGQEADWYKIILSGNLTAWVNAPYVEVIPNLPEAIVSGEAISLYLDRSASTLIKNLNPGEKIYLKDYEADWYQVVLADTTTGWVKQESIVPSIDLTVDVNRSGSRTGTNVFANIEAVASQYLGRPYQYGASGPDRFDCSGFTSFILNTYYKDYLVSRGINLPRSSRDQANIGTAVSRENLQIGDLVFFNTTYVRSNAINHVAIYIGNDRLIHAPSSGGYVRIESLSDRYYSSRYIKAVRLQ